MAIYSVFIAFFSMGVWSKTAKIVIFWRRKIFGQEIKILVHSENLKFGKNYLLPYFQPLWAKNIPTLWEKIFKFCWFTLKSSKDLQYGPISQKVFYRIFSNMPSFVFLVLISIFHKKHREESNGNWNIRSLFYKNSLPLHP